MKSGRLILIAMVLVSILAGTAGTAGAQVYNPRDEYDWTVNWSERYRCAASPSMKTVAYSL